MAQQVAQWPSREILADLVCILCNRTVGRAQGPSARTLRTISLNVDEPGHVRAVRRLRCPHCAGTLWFQNSEEVAVYSQQLDLEALALDPEHPPRRGRPTTTGKMVAP